MNLLTIDDAKLNYLDRGSGPVLLLVHGFPLDHSMWHRQIGVLQQGRRLIVPDLRGFGASSGVRDVLGMDLLADDLAALLDALHITEPITYCGLSMGGYIGWQFWRRHRDRLSRLILCDTKAAADTPEAARARHENAARAESEGSAFLAAMMREKLFAPATRHAQPAWIDAIDRVMLATSPRTIAAALRGMAARPDATPWLADIDVPTLLICGEHDAISPATEMQQIAAAMRIAKFVLIPQAGHMAPLENAAAVNAAIGDWLPD